MRKSIVNRALEYSPLASIALLLLLHYLNTENKTLQMLIVAGIVASVAANILLIFKKERQNNWLRAKNVTLLIALISVVLIFLLQYFR